ncbi:MAG: hypothetical protein HQ567_29105 [Candidatus Nealsonbacteria bacterium]|nr:hypothetical protein [Candidatus Nealsonbacteria bacterium]
MFFIQPSDDEISRALEAWQWLPIGTKKPILVTAFGDMFLAGDQGVWFLDTIEGNLKRICETEDELRETLETEDGQNHYLLAGFVERAQREDMTLADGQCYDFKLNPVVGGKIEYDNVEVQDFVVAMNIAGQLHGQVRGMPNGARVSGFTVDGESPAGP